MKMLKHFLFIITIIMSLLLPGCSKNNSETLALVGDENDMVSYYQIYPQQYFPTSEINQEVLNGRFPPDITGEYEMIGDFVDGYYEYYNQQTHQYQVLPSQAYPVSKTMYIIIENQVNGMAKIRFSLNGEWFDSNAYIFGDVYSDNNADFVVFFENAQGTDVVKYFRGNILKGKISAEGIQNITTWSVIKDRQFNSLVYGIYNLGGHEQYHADFAERKK